MRSSHVGLHKPHTNQGISLSLDRANSDTRQVVEACISRRFNDCYNTRLSHFLPELLSLAEGGQLNAVVGIRPASTQDLFLEKYLDTPVEQAISRAFRRPVDRNEVVEIGNLAAAVPGASYALLAVLARVLQQAGFRWVVCTATLQVEAMLDHMQFPSRVVCAADPVRLGEGADDWGTYYEACPRVITGDVNVASDMLRATPSMSLLLEQLAAPIDEVAQKLARWLS